MLISDNESFCVDKNLSLSGLYSYWVMLKNIGLYTTIFEF